MQKVTGLRPAVAKVYAVSRPDRSSYRMFHVDEEQSPLAEGLADMQIADWISANDSAADGTYGTGRVKVFVFEREEHAKISKISRVVL